MTRRNGSPHFLAALILAMFSQPHCAGTGKCSTNEHGMNQKVKLEPVQLIVAKPFRLDDDPEILVSPGTYPGKRKQTDAFGEVSWTKSNYMLELSVGQIKAIGARNTIAIEYDVTDHVRRGEIQVLG